MPSDIALILRERIEQDIKAVVAQNTFLSAMGKDRTIKTAAPLALENKKINHGTPRVRRYKS
ncbi:hypothetical protein [Xanthomonas oryzae]|uniref:hypothetical protein n=1 Tax=Xanthomonas oryzae TaxID=347 RepID=UPI0010721931|nr:hypothetical protein [Xanthomonas oryzae]UAD93003.1 hypothetical protein H9N23_07265 [Xanthomonas oryzae pv. oryzae]UEG96476.1 hypothetical protein LLC55_16605 [Xanthomonas oryzae pv. oryzae]UEQ23393.1 hypothetical protein LNP58_21060 [Xanthomonas oryzae pv. oryzae]UHC73446.1 hypothetical protein LUZ17_11150 [Xanthomonas oryzae pv. oryzae]WDM96659.1 hypothetical protein LL927_22310 [Xanthomonas oryzae]